MKIKAVKLITLLVSLSGISILYNNCSGSGFETKTTLVGAQSTLSVVSCNLSSGPVSVGSAVNGFLASSAVFPNLCGTTVTRTCLASGQFDGSVPLFPSCSQQCVNPDNQQSIAVGSSYAYYSVSSGATQAACDAAKVISTCQSSSGQFAPLPPAGRFATCLVQGQTCAYATAPGYSSPTGNMVGSTVMGYAAQSAVYPSLCGSQVNRTLST